MVPRPADVSSELFSRDHEVGVPFFRYSHVYIEHRKELLSIIDDVCSRGAFILQNEVQEFENELATVVGTAHAVGVANCTDGLTLSLKASGITIGDEVIFSSHTFVATAAAIRNAGATPVPVECGPDHLMDADAAEAAITPRTRAIVPTQLNGRICDMDAILSIARKHDLIVVEDAAQALGASFKGKQAGSFGNAGAFSFYPAKSLGCFGDGGAITTSDQRLYEILSRARNHGRSETGYVSQWGENSRLDNLQAAILIYKLELLRDEIEKRRHFAGLYHEMLLDVEEVVLPPGPDDDSDRFDTYQNYEIEATNREALVEFLSSRRIGTSVQWGGWAVHQFEELGFKCRLPITEDLFKRMLLLPLNTSLTSNEVTYVAASLREFYAYPH